MNARFRKISVLLLLTVFVISLGTSAAAESTGASVTYGIYAAQYCSDNFSQIFVQPDSSFARTYYNNMRSDKDLMAEFDKWEYLHIATSPGYSMESGMFTLKDYYRVVLFDLLTCQTSGSVTDYVSSLTGKVSNDYTIFAKDLAEEIANWENASFDKISSLPMTPNRRSAMENCVKKWSENAKVFEDVTIILDLAKDCAEAVDLVGKYLTLTNMHDGTQEVLTYIANDTANPFALRQAAHDCLNCFNNSSEDIANAIINGEIEFAKDLVIDYVDFAWEAVVALIPGANIVFLGAQGMRAFTNLFTGEDAQIKAYYQIQASVVCEDAITRAMTAFESRFLNSQTEKNAVIYVRAVEMYEANVLLGYDYSIKLLEVVNGTPKALLFGQKENISQLIQDIKSLKRSKQKNYDAFHSLILDNYDIISSNAGAIVHNFSVDGESSDFYSISGNTHSGKGTVVYRGLSMDVCLKLEADTRITFTAPHNGQLLLIFNKMGYWNSEPTDAIGASVIFDGDSTSYTVLDGGDYGYISIPVTAGAHELRRGSRQTYLYYMVFTPKQTVHSHKFTCSVTKAATCTNDGIWTYSCACGESYTETILTTGHRITSSVTAPTCTAQGYTTFTCQRCGTSYTGNKTKATGHSYALSVSIAPTCTDGGMRIYSCFCGDSYNEMVSATGHSFTGLVTSPTCTKQGYTTFTCKSCGTSYTDDVTPATGHSYLSETTAPTCTEQGRTTFSCVTCSHSYTTILDAIDHSYVNDICTVCGQKNLGEYVHNFTRNRTDSSFYAIYGNTHSGKGDIVYNGVTMDVCLKLEAATSITFTAPSDGELLLIFNTVGYWDSAPADAIGASVGFDGDTSTYTIQDGGGYGYVTIPVTAGDHELRRGDKQTFLYYMAYTPAEEPDEAPTLNVYGKTLALEDMVQVSYYFTLENIADDDITASGLQVWNEADYATEADPTYTVDGLTKNGSYYNALSQGIPAKNMGDILYARAYVTQVDGTTVYSDVIAYSAAIYAENQYNKTSDSAIRLKPLIIALMNYGAAAQIQFSYDTGSLMNSFLTAEEQTTAWDDAALNVSAEDTAGKYALQTENSSVVITKINKSVSLEGALAVNIYATVDADVLETALEVGVLYWDAETYAGAEALTARNSVKLPTVVNGNYRVASIDGVAAKNMSGDCYACVYVIDADGNTHYSELIAYNAHNYAANQIAKNEKPNLVALCKAIVIYGNAANVYFAD